MRLALIPPVSLLEYTDETDMQLMLPHLIHNEIYRYVYQKHCDSPNQFVILDNGVAEGVEVQNWDLYNAAMAYGVNEMVAPDILQDAHGTLHAWKKWRNWVSDNGIDLRGLRIMYVLQGKNRDEFFEQAARAAHANFKCDTIGIPRHALTTCNDENIRRDLAKEIYRLTRYQRRMQPKAVHLLGGSPDFPTELRLFVLKPWARSTDTSAPFNYAFEGLVLHGANAGVKRPNKYFNRPWEDFNLEVLGRNLKKINKWCEEAR